MTELNVYKSSVDPESPKYVLCDNCRNTCFEGYNLEWWQHCERRLECDVCGRSNEEEE